MFKFGENIIRLRKDKGVTQEQMADFLGVTKASVSKWETKQSMPDISLLPIIASYFDVSIDDLLGYEPKLTVEEIEKIYGDLSSAFASEPFEDVMGKSEALVKQYYNCYPFLLQTVVLWINHYMMAENEERQREILQKASELCDIVMDKEKDQAKRNEALSINAYVLFLLGHYEKVIESLENLADPMNAVSVSQNLLIQAYMASGETQKSEQYNQLLIYNDIIGTIMYSTYYLAGNIENQSKSIETIERVLQIIEIYNMTNINPNTVAIFLLQAATTYSTYDMKNEFFEMLDKYIHAMDILFGDEIVLVKSDDYFDKIEQIIKQRDEIKQVPRDKRLIFASAISVFEQPAFAKYKDEKKFKSLKQYLERKGEKICN